MIEAKELRVGNWVNYLYEWQSIDTIGLYSVGLTGNGINTTLENLSPIPLTPEILEKAGFSKSMGSIWWEDSERLPLSEIAKKFFYSICLSVNKSEWIDVTHIKHLHQLQNLYFALTGEELELKP
jgi:hypothetical protein